MRRMPKKHWIDSVIEDTEKQVKKYGRETSKKKSALLQELDLVELYIRNTTPTKRRRAMKSRGRIIAQLREFEK